MTIRHFPSGMPYREVGETTIIAKDDATADFLANMFETFERMPKGILVTSCDEFSRESCITPKPEFSVTEINWLKRIESILRNGLPTSDKGAAETIGHAHSEVELLLESIDPDWCMR